MIIEHNGKKYDSETWHKKVLLGLLSKELELVSSKKKELQALKDFTYGNRILELDQKEKDIKYKLDLLSGKPMI